ncbi:MAG: formylglycine-generating enzyme family protein [Planctomycetota bacterium]
MVTVHIFPVKSLAVIALFFVMVTISCTTTDNNIHNKKPELTNSKLVLLLDNNINIELMHIPSGSFIMGSETNLNEKDSDFHEYGPQHKVIITKPFFISKFEVTQEQYRHIMNINPSYFVGDNLPVEQVSWYDAMEFCSLLSQKTNYTITLPTEAQWEYACRANTTTEYYFGSRNTVDIFSDKTGLSIYAWCNFNASFSNNRCLTHPVGQKKPNNYGLYDMYGNVMEWCSDWYSNDYYENSPLYDPMGPEKPIMLNFKVIRSSPSGATPGSCRSSFRMYNSPEEKRCDTGFRIVINMQ